MAAPAASIDAAGSASAASSTSSWASSVRMRSRPAAGIASMKSVSATPSSRSTSERGPIRRWAMRAWCSACTVAPGSGHALARQFAGRQRLRAVAIGSQHSTCHPSRRAGRDAPLATPARRGRRPAASPPSRGEPGRPGCREGGAAVAVDQASATAAAPAAARHVAAEHLHQQRAVALAERLHQRPPSPWREKPATFTSETPTAASSSSTSRRLTAAGSRARHQPPQRRRADRHQQRRQRAVGIVSPASTAAVETIRIAQVPAVGPAW